MSEPVKIELQPELVKALKAMIDEAPDPVILAHVQAHPEYQQGGFNATARNLSTFRLRLKAEIRSPLNLGSSIAWFLGACDLARPLIAVLSREALEYGFEIFLGFYGKIRFLANLMIDSRDDVRGLARNYLDRPDWQTAATLDRDEAQAKLDEYFAPLIGCVALWMPPENKEPDLSSPPPIVTESLLLPASGEVEKAQADLNRERKSHEHTRERLKKVEDELREHCAEAQRQIDYEKKRAAEQSRAAKEALAELDLVKAEKVQAIAEGIQSELQSEIRRWMDAPRRVDEAAQRALAAPPGKDVLVRAEEALGRQAEQDRHFGNLTALRGRLETLETALARIRSAQSEALKPLPELASLARDLEAELGQIRQTLHVDAGESEIYRSLRALINRAESGESIREAFRFIEEANRKAVLDANSFGNLQVFYRDKMQQVMIRREPKIEVVRPSQEDGMGFLRWALRHNAASLWLVDGHNVLLGPNGGVRAPDLAAREKLVTCIAAAFGRAPQCRIQVVFDGPQRGETQRAQNVLEIYSGGEGEHRADTAILEYLEFHRRSQSAIPRFIVTDDVDLARQAGQMKAVQIRVTEWIAFLQHA